MLPNAYFCLLPGWLVSSPRCWLLFRVFLVTPRLTACSACRRIASTISLTPWLPSLVHTLQNHFFILNSRIVKWYASQPFTMQNISQPTGIFINHVCPSFVFQVVVPALLPTGWVCVSFDMTNKKAVVFHPLRPKGMLPPESNRLVALAAIMLQALRISFGDTYDPKFTPLHLWDFVIHTWDGPPIEM